MRVYVAVERAEGAHNYVWFTDRHGNPWALDLDTAQVETSAYAVEELEAEFIEV